MRASPLKLYQPRSELEKEQEKQIVQGLGNKELTQKEGTYDEVVKKNRVRKSLLDFLQKSDNKFVEGGDTNEDVESSAGKGGGNDNSDGGAEGEELRIIQEKLGDVSVGDSNVRGKVGLSKEGADFEGGGVTSNSSTGEFYKEKEGDRDKGKSVILGNVGTGKKEKKNWKRLARVMEKVVCGNTCDLKRKGDLEEVEKMLVDEEGGIGKRHKLSAGEVDDLSCRAL